MQEQLRTTRRRVITGAASAAVGLGAAKAKARPSSGDLLLHNAKVYTVDRDDTVQSAIWISDGVVRAVGSSRELLNQAPKGIRRIDLGGCAVTPGFVDGHPHLIDVGLRALRPRWGLLRSIKDIQMVVEREVARLQPGEWLVMPPLAQPPEIYRFPEVLAEGRWPDRHDLDRVSPRNPVYIESHFMAPPGVAIANSLAVRTARPPPGWVPPFATRIERDSGGEPTGRYFDFNFPRRIPPRSASGPAHGFPQVPGHGLDARTAVLEGMRLFNAAGVTTTYEGHGFSLEHIDLYRQLERDGAISVRTYCPIGFPFGAYDDAARQDALFQSAVAQAGGNGVGSDLFRVGGVQFSFDSAAASGKCLMREPYTSPDGITSHGVQNTSDEQLRRAVYAAARAGLRVQVQCSGGLAIDKVLALFEEVDRELPIRGKRWVIEHCQFPSAENMATCAKLGVVPTTCVTFLWDYGAVYRKTFGEEIANQAIPFRSWVEAGLPVSSSTDAHPYEPMFVFWLLLSRQDGHSRRPLGADQSLTRAQALRTYTLNGAHAAFWDDKVGSLEPGKLADLCVLSQDIMTVDQDRIPETKVLATLLGGKVVHDHGIFG